MLEGTSSLTVSPSSSDLASQHSHGKMVVSEPCHRKDSISDFDWCLPEICHIFHLLITLLISTMNIQELRDFYHLSFSELSPDLHSIKVPARVGAPVVVSNPDFLYNITNVLQLCETHLIVQIPTATV